MSSCSTTLPPPQSLQMSVRHLTNTLQQIIFSSKHAYNTNNDSFGRFNVQRFCKKTAHGSNDNERIMFLHNDQSTYLIAKSSCSFGITLSCRSSIAETQYFQVRIIIFHRSIVFLLFESILLSMFSFSEEFLVIIFRTIMYIN